MLMGHDTGGFAATSAPDGFGIKEFEEAGLRSVERRFEPKDTIFTPGDPDDQLYFLLSGTVRLFSSFSERLRQSDEVIESLLHREVSNRLATLLINLGSRFGESNGSGLTLDVRLTHQDLANMIASTREAVSKVMSEFQRDGYIEVKNRKITLLDRQALADYASPSGLSVDGQLTI
jgi:CRP-like cAMP-binding protein